MLIIVIILIQVSLANSALISVAGVVGEQTSAHALFIPVRCARGLAAAGLHREGGRRPAPGDAGGAAAAAAAGGLGGGARAAAAAALRDTVPGPRVGAHTAGMSLHYF